MSKSPWSIQSLEDSIQTILEDDYYWFPVRHHSSAVARHLQTAIALRKPKVIFIEAPADAQSLIPHITDTKTKPPIAIYSSYRDDDNVLGLAGIHSPSEDIPARFSSWYPLTNYSPEYIAMRAATSINAEVVFIDLPHHALIKSRQELEDLEELEEEQEAGIKESVRTRLPEVNIYQRIAKNAGFNDWDEAWDSLFEFGDYGEDLERFRRELATFCAAARQTSRPQMLELDGTLPRERFMWRQIQETLQQSKIQPSETMIVCGGFHLYLNRDDKAEPPSCPQGTHFNAIIPYSFFQISELSGYAAGNRAPRFYQRVWETEHGATDEWLAQHIVAIIKQARKEGENVSSADAISVAQHCRMLASLRGRKIPILEDIEDAVMTCCCKGDPNLEGQYLMRAISMVNIGDKVGKVTDLAPMLPLVRDYYHQLESLGLQLVSQKEKVVKLKLDLREAEQRAQSVFLHRLTYLSIPLAVMVEGNVADINSGTIFREVWKLKWDPKTEPKLIENNLYGDTIEAAVLAKLEVALAKAAGDAGHTCEILREAVNMELPALVDKMEALCEQAIANDGRFISLSKAVHELQLLKRHAIYQQVKHDIVDSLLEEAFDRACFSLPDSANVGEEEQESLIEALKVVSEAMLANEQFEREIFQQYVKSAAEITESLFLRGAFLGMLTELRVWPAEELSAELANLAYEATEIKVQAGDFLDGILCTCRTSLLVGADHLIAAIEELFTTCDEESYLIMLPRLRIAFTRLHARQLDSFADRVAQRLELKDSAQLSSLETSVETAILFARIDKQVAAIMSQWNF